MNRQGAVRPSAISAWLREPACSSVTTLRGEAWGGGIGIGINETATDSAMPFGRHPIWGVWYGSGMFKHTLDSQPQLLASGLDPSCLWAQAAGCRDPEEDRPSRKNVPESVCRKRSGSSCSRRSSVTLLLICASGWTRCSSLARLGSLIPLTLGRLGTSRNALRHVVLLSH